MRFEHFAVNVPDAAAMADWCVAHLGMRIAHALDVVPHTRFVADETGRTVAEFYTNPKDPVPDFTAQHPLRFHWAFAVDDPGGERDRLVAAGAAVETEETLDDGSQLIMLRDPWGVPLQLCRRTRPMP